MQAKRNAASIGRTQFYGQRMEGRIFEFRWKDQFTPYFRVLSQGMVTEHFLPFGSHISISVTRGQTCVGYEKDGIWFPCASGGLEGTRKCEECKKMEGMPVAQYCDGFNTALFSGAELESLNFPHYVYFAQFDKGLIKVGVSSSSRGYLRQIEQGSHFALIIAEGMWGIPARQIETTLRRSGIIDKIQSSQKKDLVFPHITAEEGEKELRSLAEKHLPAVLAVQPQFEQFIKQPAEFMEFESYYRLKDAQDVQKPLHDPTIEVGEYVSGRVLSVKGPFLVIETDAEKILIDAKKLKGYAVDFSPKPIGLKKEEAFQGALF